MHKKGDGVYVFFLKGQIEVVQNLISGPIDHRALQDATRGLKDVIYKQGVLKQSSYQIELHLFAS